MMLPSQAKIFSLLAQAFVCIFVLRSHAVDLILWRHLSGVVTFCGNANARVLQPQEPL
jgi:hypothetical protein